jgi:hypothetical protein
MRAWIFAALLPLACSLDPRVLTVTDGDGDSDGGAGDTTGSGAAGAGNTNSSGGTGATGATGATSSDGGTTQGGNGTGNATSGGNNGSGGNQPVYMCQELTKDDSECEYTAVGTGSGPLIDNFEDDNNQINVADGHDGYWWVFDDGTGTSTPAQGDAPIPVELDEVRPGGTGTQGLRFSGSGYSEWGGGLGVNLYQGVGDQFACYDAHVYAGVSFYAKGSGNVRFSVALPGTENEVNGGACKCKDPDANPPDCPCCWGSWGVELVLDADEWTHFSFSWNELMPPPPDGNHTPFEPEEIRNLNFSAEPPSWDFWIDDVWLME